MVGWSEVLNGYQHAFRWTSGAGMTDLGTLAGPNNQSQAYDVSGDGSVVVGWSGTATDGSSAFRWTASTGMQKSQFAAGQRRMNSAKLRMQWTHRFGQGVDATVWAAGARSFGDAIELTAAVPMAGELVPTALTPNTWAEYGGRVGFKLSPQVTADLSLAAVSGFDGMGTSAELRTAARLVF